MLPPCASSQFLLMWNPVRTHETLSRRVTRTCSTLRVKADGLVGGDVHEAMQSQGFFRDAVDVWAHAKSNRRLFVLVDVVSRVGGLDVHLLKELQRDVALGADEPLFEILQSRSHAYDDVSRGDGQGDLHLAFLCLRFTHWDTAATVGSVSAVQCLSFRRARIARTVTLLLC